MVALPCIVLCGIDLTGIFTPWSHHGGWNTHGALGSRTQPYLLLLWLICVNKAKLKFNANASAEKPFCRERLRPGSIRDGYQCHSNEQRQKNHILSAEIASQSTSKFITFDSHFVAQPFFSSITYLWWSFVRLLSRYTFILFSLLPTMETLLSYWQLGAHCHQCRQFLFHFRANT